MIGRGSALSRGLALAALGGLGLLIIITVILPLSDWKNGVFAGRAAAMDEAGRLKGSIAQLQAEADQLSDNDAGEHVWTAKQLGEATARIQTRIGELAEVNGLAIRSIAPSGERVLPMSRGVAFHIELEAALDKLADFLISLEYHMPALAVERAALRRLARPGPPTEQPLLFVQLDILAPVHLPGEDNN